MFKLPKFLKKNSPQRIYSDETKAAMRAKYQAFQTLLTSNNQVLELMADMEEKFSGEYLFDVSYIRTNVRLIGYEVLKIIENLNALSQEKYKEFYKIHNEISKEIEKMLEYKLEVPASDLTIPVEDLAGNSAGITGGKIAHLGEIKNSLNLPIPEGFAISAYAFVKFMNHNNLIEKINTALSSLSVDDLEELNRVSRGMYEMIIQAEIPPELEEAIRGAYTKLSKKIGTNPNVSVRSSAIREDSEFSFAGQYATFLNVPADLILQKYKEVIASLFTPPAIFYSKTGGFSEGEMVMAVGVLKMVESVAGGVMYSRDPNDPNSDHILINAVHGLGVWVVDGTVTPDIYIVSRHPAGTILERRISNQEKMLVCGQAGEVKAEEVPEKSRGKQCISDKEIRDLSSYALALENYYGFPQDIEWAIGTDDKIYILQSRPLRTAASEPDVCIPRRFEGYKVILDKGVIACKGVGFGKVFLLKDDEELKNFPDGGVLVAEHTSPKFVTVMNKAAAIITDVGSVTGHMASLSREYQIPTILDTEASTALLRDGQEITVDAINCNIYEGEVEELVEYAKKKKEPFKGTHLFKTLEKVLKWVVPLNLTDPDSETFRPEYCRSYHDITRFAHEIAMHEMFSIGQEKDIEDTGAIDLIAGIPIGVRVLDIDGGLRENLKKASFEDVFSVPLIALLKGMKSMKWPGPPPVDAKGFLGMLARTASVPEDELQETGKRSFAVVSKNYANFSIRLGYHLSMIEAYAGENMNDNYIKFFFKGGGASVDRRLRRVRLITEILKTLGFKIAVKEDVVEAILTKYKQATIEEKLEVMGKLTAYTKQLDMVMFNDAVTDMYVDQFVKEHVKGKSAKAL